MDRSIKQMFKEKKEEWLGKMCEEVEQLEKVNSRLMAEKIRENNREAQNKQEYDNKRQKPLHLDRKSRGFKEVRRVR